MNPPGGTAAVVVGYGGPDDLAGCVASLAGAGAAAIVVVDNGPPAERIDAASLRAAAGAASLEVLAPGENLGYGRAVNLALERVDADLVLVSNPDLRLEGGALAAMRAALDGRPRAAAATPRLLSADGGAHAEVRDDPPGIWRDLATLAGLGRGRVDERPDEAGAPRAVRFLSGACFLARSRALREVGGFDPRFFLYYEDADLSRRLTAAGWEILRVPAAAARHAHGGTWRDPVARQAAGLSGALVYHRKHGGRAGAILYRLGLLILYLPRLLLGGILPIRTSFTAGERARMIRETIAVAWGPAAARRRS